MDKREVILKLMGEIEEWANDNDIATSAMDQIELAERIYNLLRRALGGEWLRADRSGAEYELTSSDS